MMDRRDVLKAAAAAAAAGGVLGAKDALAAPPATPRITLRRASERVTRVDDAPG